MADEPADTISAGQIQDRRILILYGSETGNSQDSAEDLQRLAERLHFEADVFEMDDVKLRTLMQYPLVIFVVSTTGQGEFPQNSRKLWKQFLYSKLPPTYLSRVRFTTFGLGDSSYPKYNFSARKLHKRLEQLGAVEFYPRGEADERHDDGIDGGFIPWSLSLRSHLLSEYPLPEGLLPIPTDIHLPPRFTLELASKMENRMDVDSGAAKVLFGQGSKPEGAQKQGDAAEAELQDILMPDRQETVILDHKAAQFSHVDAVDPEGDEWKLMTEREQPNSNATFARGSERLADQIPGGIDTLDRPNVLRDAPSKYLLDDVISYPTELPPDDMLPIPNGWTATVSCNIRVTPRDHWQDVRHLTLIVQAKPEENPDDSSPQCLDYQPGDVVVLYPKNFPEDVQALIDRMEWNDVADKPFVHFTKRRDKQIGFEHAPKNCYPLPDTTLRQLLTHNYDITAIPKRHFFDHIKFFTEDRMHFDRLSEFADTKYTDEFYDYTSRPRRSILEVLQEFSTVKIPWRWVPSVFPIIRGREYSIASGGSLLGSRKDNSTRVELLIALIKYKTVLRKTRQGLCSRYLETVLPDTEICIGFKDHKGPSLDRDFVEHHPVLAIATGTGIAPIRSYFWERRQEPRHADHVLFFGGRNRASDFYFEDDWKFLGVKVFTAFSRDQKEKIYVQDVIRREFKTVCKLVEKRAIVCVCGSAGKMPEAVRLALYDALVLGGMAEDQDGARAVFDEKAHFWEEVW